MCLSIKKTPFTSLRNRLSEQVFKKPPKKDKKEATFCIILSLTARKEIKWSKALV